MVNKKSSVIIAAIVGVFCFLSVVYVSSCTKPGIPVSCDGIVCNNGGFCLIDTVDRKPVPECICPSGFEGSNCATASVTKYLGTWTVVQTTIGSDSAKSVGTDTTYSVTIEKSATPTTFMIDGLCGDQNYNDIVCSIDSNYTNGFIIDSTSAFHMIFDHFKLTENASGVIVPGQEITTTLYTRHLNASINWIHDTFSVVMRPN